MPNVRDKSSEIPFTVKTNISKKILLNYKIYLYFIKKLIFYLRAVVILSLWWLYFPQSLTIICCNLMNLADLYSTLLLFCNPSNLKNDFWSTQNFTCRRQIKTLEFSENLRRQEQGGDNYHHATVNPYAYLRFSWFMRQLMSCKKLARDKISWDLLTTNGVVCFCTCTWRFFCRVPLPCCHISKWRW